MFESNDRFKKLKKSKQTNHNDNHVNGNQTSPLKFINVRYINSGNLYFYQLWFDEYNELVLGCKNISSKWSEIVTDKDNCSNITKLTLFGTFDNKSFNNSICSGIISNQMLQATQS